MRLDVLESWHLSGYRVNQDLDLDRAEIHCFRASIRESISVRATGFAPLVRCTIFALCSGIVVPLSIADCGKTTEPAANLALTHSPASIQMLAKEIQGKKEDEVSAAIVKRFGPASRNVGSGIISPEWDVESGVLNYRLGLVSFRAKGGRVVWLTATINKALPTVTSDGFEMTTPPSPQMRYWLGDLEFQSGSKYKFIDSRESESLHHREKQTNNFFLKHPEGRFTIQFGPGCSPDAVLERLPDATVLCSVVLFPADDSSEATFYIVAYPSERRLRFSRKNPPLEFVMDKGW